MAARFLWVSAQAHIVQHTFADNVTMSGQMGGVATFAFERKDTTHPTDASAIRESHRERTIMSNCAIGGDHPASGSRASSMIVPAGYVAGYKCWFLLDFCEDHIEPTHLNEYPPGTHFHGKLQIGVKE